MTIGADVNGRARIVVVAGGGIERLLALSGRAVTHVVRAWILIIALHIAGTGIQASVVFLVAGLTLIAGILRRCLASLSGVAHFGAVAESAIVASGIVCVVPAGVTVLVTTVYRAGYAVIAGIGPGQTSIGHVARLHAVAKIAVVAGNSRVLADAVLANVCRACVAVVAVRVCGTAARDR